MVQNIVQSPETLPPAALPAKSSCCEIAFMDMAVPQYAMLTASVRSGVEVILLNARQDGIEQITQVLRRRRNLSCIHLISPGTAGSVQLGKAVLSLNTLERYVWDLTLWGNALKTNAELLVYGSEVARGVRGEEFVEHLSELIGVKVAASRSKTGSAEVGGNWDLELQTMPCQTALAFEPAAMAVYSALL